MRATRAAATAAAGAAVAAVVGCVPASRYREPRAALAGTGAPSVDATVAALAGEWTGQYDGPLYARRGVLGLSLRPVAGRPATGRAEAGRAAGTVAGSATLRHGATPSHIAVDSAQVGRGRVVLFLAPFADPESGATIRVRLDGALAADTLGGRLRADGAATAAAERRGGWRLVRVARPAAP
jgi:hypothetical protein